MSPFKAMFMAIIFTAFTIALMAKMNSGLRTEARWPTQYETIVAGVMMVGMYLAYYNVFILLFTL